MFIVPSTLVTIARFPLGYRVHAVGDRPEKRLELYDMEACPYCRKVREALTMLDLEVLVKPSPHGGERFRPEAVARGGKAQFPLLVDPNLGVELYESDAIVKHLYKSYGQGSAPLGLRMGVLGDARSFVASSFRATSGRSARKSHAPREPLHLWSFELSPYSRRVRETLSELEIPYVLHNVGRGSANRPALLERAGKVMVPYLEDPNTGASLFESRDIVRYLETTYSVRAAGSRAS